MRQTWALILDAYRELNARKIFWIVLIISTLIAGVFAAVGLSPVGFTILWKEFPTGFNSSYMSPAAFYKMLFLDLGVQWWLGLLATILALLSTASLFPDLLSGGAIDLYLSKPIGRLRLFLTKYICGLLFVALQISGFCLASFLVIGLRGKQWEPAVFLAIPIVVLFYSYLYCICTLVGVVTRSTITAILLTLVFWVVVFGVHLTELELLKYQLTEQRDAHNLDRRIAAAQTDLRNLDSPARPDPAKIEPAPAPDATLPATRAATTEPGHFVLPSFLRGLTLDPNDSLKRRRLQSQIEHDRTERAKLHGGFVRPHQVFLTMMTCLPKTAETIDLLERQLTTRARLSDPEQDANEQTDRRGNPQADVELLHTALLRRSVSWVVGTSLAFEAVVLGLAAWVFCRRDY